MKLRRRFALPSAVKPTSLIKRAYAEKCFNKILKALTDIVARCESCQRLAPRPLVFPVSFPNESVFNHEMFLVHTWIEPRPQIPALHVVDRGTYFSTA